MSVQIDAVPQFSHSPANVQQPSSDDAIDAKTIKDAHTDTRRLGIQVTAEHDSQQKPKCVIQCQCGIRATVADKAKRECGDLLESICLVYFVS